MWRHIRAARISTRRSWVPFPPARQQAQLIHPARDDAVDCCSYANQMSRAVFLVSVLFGIASASCTTVNSPNQVSDDDAIEGVVSGVDREAVRKGTCRGRLDVDMQKVEFLDNDAVTISAAEFSVRLTIDGERIGEDWRRPMPRHTWEEIETLIVDSSGDIDLAARFARVDGAITVYWRETYLHRSYRQGLLGISVEGLYPLCQGAAGADGSRL